MKNSCPVVFVCIVLLILGWPRVTGAEPEETGRVLGRYKVRSIAFDFVGNRTYKDKRLVGILSFKPDEHIDAILAEFGREDLKEFYLKKGFAFAEVKLDNEKLSEGKVVYTITEGPRVKIKSVKLDGNKKMKTVTLKKAIKTTKKEWFFWPRRYTEEGLDEDVERLEDAYWERGFLDYKITAKREFTDDKSKIRITFTIDEGPIYTVGKITFKFIDEEGKGPQNAINRVLGTPKQKPTGSEYFDQKRLRAELKLEPGQGYRKRTAESDRKRLLKLYREHGFVDAQVNIYIDRVLDELDEGQVRQSGESVLRGMVNVEFGISERQQFRIGRIDITGNKQTQDKVIRRVLDGYGFQPYRYYNAEIAHGDGSGELEKEVRRMVFAEEATITPLASEQSDQKNVEVNIKEGQTGMWMLGAGVSSDRGVIGSMVWEQRNFDINDWPENFGEFVTGQAFRGAGQTLRVSLQPGTELSLYSVHFSEPYLHDKPISLDVTGSDYEWERESYDENRMKGYIRLGERYEKRYKDLWRRSISFRVEDVDVDGVHFDAPKEIKDVKGSNVLVGLKLGIGKDLTNDQFSPSEGYHLTGDYEQVSGDYTFGILSGTFSRYRTIYEDLAEHKTVLATKLHAATVLGNAPPYEKFYAGGMHSMRGFDYRGISTRGKPVVNGVPIAGREKKDPIGSDWIFLANAEVIMPLVSEEFAALFFVDSGTIDSGSYRASVGTGIQIIIPQWFGPVPMRFEVAAPLMKDDSDDTQIFSFSVGRLF